MARLERWFNLGRELLWYLAVMAVAVVIWEYIDLQFLPIGDIPSIDDFRAGIVIMVFVGCLFVFLWWRAVNTRIPELAWLRRHIERYSLLDSLVPITLLFLTAILLYFRDPFILNRDLQHRYRLTCIYIIPTAYAMMMYLLPPRQIARVIMPGPEPVDLLLRCVAVAALGGFGFWQFSINFL